MQPITGKPRESCFFSALFVRFFFFFTHMCLFDFPAAGHGLLWITEGGRVQTGLAVQGQHEQRHQRHDAGLCQDARFYTHCTSIFNIV